MQVEEAITAGESISDKMHGTMLLNGSLMSDEARYAILLNLGGNLGMQAVSDAIERANAARPSDGKANFGGSKFRKNFNQRGNKSGFGKPSYNPREKYKKFDRGNKYNSKHRNAFRRNFAKNFSEKSKRRPEVEGGESKGVKNKKGYKCYACGSEFHLAGSSNCKSKHQGHGRAHNAKVDETDPMEFLSKASPIYFLRESDTDGDSEENDGDGGEQEDGSEEEEDGISM
jgi:hypothetical protein